MGDWQTVENNEVSFQDLECIVETRAQGWTTSSGEDAQAVSSVWLQQGQVGTIHVHWELPQICLTARLSLEGKHVIQMFDGVAVNSWKIEQGFFWSSRL